MSRSTARVSAVPGRRCPDRDPAQRARGTWALPRTRERARSTDCGAAIRRPQPPEHVNCGANRTPSWRPIPGLAVLAETRCDSPPCDSCYRCLAAARSARSAHTVSGGDVGSRRHTGAGNGTSNGTSDRVGRVLLAAGHGQAGTPGQRAFQRRHGRARRPAPGRSVHRELYRRWQGPLGGYPQLGI